MNDSKVLTKQFSVLFWDSHPEEGREPICFEGKDFSDPNKAMRLFLAPIQDSDIMWVEIDGFTDEQLSKLGVSRYRKNPNFRPRSKTSNEWRSQIAHEAGMLHGISAYNEEMGYD